MNDYRTFVEMVRAAGLVAAAEGIPTRLTVTGLGVTVESRHGERVVEKTVSHATIESTNTRSPLADAVLKNAELLRGVAKIA